MAFDLKASIRLVDKMSGPLGKIKSGMKDTEKAVKTFADANGRLRDEFGRFVGEANKADTAVKKYKSTLSGLSAKSLVSPFTAITGGITAAVGAIGAYKTASDALDLSNQAEQAQIGFTTMLGSAKKAEDFLSDLSKFANATPFELPQLRDASKRLLAFGFDAKQIIPMMTAVGDASAGLGAGSEGIDRITRALGQIRSNGRLNTEDVNQLTEVGVGAWDIIAKKMNTTTERVRKLTESGLIPANAAVNMLVSGMEEKFGGLMDLQSKSLGGLWSTVKDNFNNNVLLQFGNGISNALKPKLEWLVNWIGSNGPTIDAWAKKIKNWAYTATNWVIDKMTKLAGWVRSFTDDPAWQASSLEDKIKEMARSATKGITEWMGEDGEKIALAAGELGVKIGSALFTGMTTGFLLGVEKNNWLAQMSPYANGEKYQDSVSKFIAKDKRLGANQPLLSGETTLKGGSTDKPAWYEKAWDGVKSAGSFIQSGGGMFSHAGGLSNVPYNQYPAQLHKGEMVLTQAEANQYRSGRGGVSLTVNMNGTVIREEADIPRIIDGIVRELESVMA